MTSEEFLRRLALKAEIVQVRTTEPYDEEYGKGEDVYVDPVLVIALDTSDADEFLALTGIRVE